MKTTQKIAGVYIVTGFIESGKTTLIHSMLEDKGFSRGEKTLIISCEEGIEEYDEVFMQVISGRLRVQIWGSSLRAFDYKTSGVVIRGKISLRETVPSRAQICRRNPPS